MKFVNLGLQHVDELLNLEGEMYWRGEKWKKLWEKEAKEKFRSFIKDYLTNFPQGCFGLVEKGELVGAMFLTKTLELKPIPYLHEFSDYFEEDGKIAYVSLFCAKRGKYQEEIAQNLYDEAEKVAFLKLKCKTIAVVIYSSPIELRALQSHNYEKLDRQFEWEIYPGKIVPCWIYYYDLLFEESG